MVTLCLAFLPRQSGAQIEKPLLNSRLGASGTFWLYAAICGTGFVCSLARVPETKGKSLEEIEQQLKT